MIYLQLAAELELTKYFTQEGQTGVIKIHEFDPETVERMLEFMYNEPHDYEANEANADEDGLHELEEDHKVEPGNADAVKQGETEFSSQNKANKPLLEEEEETSTSTESSLFHPILPSAEILLCHTRVNAIASYYNIPRLRKLANSKIENILATGWSAAHFLTVASEILQSNDDKALHKVIALTAAEHIEELIESKKFTKLIDSTHFTAFALAVLQNTVTAHRSSADELKTAQFRIQNLERECGLERSNVDRITERSNGIVEKFDECRRVLKRWDNCRNISCNAEFSCWIEGGGESSYLLRCARCQCRHRITD